MAQPPNRPPQGPAHADLPQHARERLAGMRQHHFFTSDLSVNEFLLVKEVGFQPLGLVMGSSIYHIGFAGRAMGQNMEMTHAHPGALPRARARDDAHGGGGRRARRRRHRRRAARREPPRVGHERHRVPRHRHRRASTPTRRQSWRAPNGKPFTERSLGPGLLDAAPRRLPAARLRDGQLRLSHRAAGPMPWLTSTQNMELPELHAGASTTRASSRWSACRPRRPSSAPRASSACTIDETNHTWGYNILEFSRRRHRRRRHLAEPQDPRPVARAQRERLRSAPCRPSRATAEPSSICAADADLAAVDEARAGRRPPHPRAAAPRRRGGPAPASSRATSRSTSSCSRATRSASPSRR